MGATFSPLLHKSHLGGAREWGSPVLRRGRSGAQSWRACGETQSEGCALRRRGAPVPRLRARAEVGLRKLQPPGRSLWLFQMLWRIQKGKTPSFLALQQSGLQDYLREGI